MAIDGVYVATAYVMSGGSGIGRTASGTVPVRGRTIATDPKVIPIGSKVRIEGFDSTFVAEDTGGDIKGKRIDIYFGDDTKNPDFRQQALNFGRRSVEVRLVSGDSPVSSDSSTSTGESMSSVSRSGGGNTKTLSEAMKLLAAESGVGTTPPSSAAPAPQAPAAGKFPSTGSVNAVKTGDRYISEFAKVAINYDLQIAGANGANVPEVIKTRARNLNKIITEAEKETSYKYPTSNINKLYSR